MKSLTQRLDDAKQALDALNTSLGRIAGRLSPEIEAQLRTSVDATADIAHWHEMFNARKVAWDLLDGLEAKAPEGLVTFGATKARYQHVRLIGVQAYLTLNWALADRIVGVVGRILCTPDGGSNPQSPAQLVSHFVQKDRKKTTVGAAFDSIRRTFGWPIGVSYAIRNHFVHDGAQAVGVDFFEGPDPKASFRITNDGWTRIETRAREYGVDATCHRAGPQWPAAPRDDLRAVLAVCEREMDDALGILLGSACRSLAVHAGMLLGED